MGVIHAVPERERLAMSADRDGPALLRADLASLIRSADGERRPLPGRDAAEDALDERYDAIEIRRYGHTESEYTDWIVGKQRERDERTVTYTGDNNVTYERTCTPSKSDVRVLDGAPVYLPMAATTTRLGEYEYEYDHAFAANGDARVTVTDPFDACVHRTDSGDPITYCANCGSLSCDAHVREGRLVGEPVCIGCSITGDFFIATKHFYDEANREAFTEEHAAMPFYRKPLENPRLAAAMGAAVQSLLFFLISALSRKVTRSTAAIVVAFGRLVEVADATQRLGEHVDADPETSLVDVERGRVMGARMVRPDDQVGGKPAALLDALHEEGRVLARAEVGGRNDLVDAVDSAGDVRDVADERGIAVGTGGFADHVELELTAV